MNKEGNAEASSQDEDEEVDATTETPPSQSSSDKKDDDDDDDDFKQQLSLGPRPSGETNAAAVQVFEYLRQRCKKIRTNTCD